MATRTTTLQVHTSRARERSVISSAIKEIERDRQDGQPYVPGKGTPLDGSGNFLSGCPETVCPEEYYGALLSQIRSGQLVVDSAVPSGSDFKTPLLSKGIHSVWFDDLEAVMDEHYTSADPNTITPTTPLASGTEVKVRFEAY